MTPSKGIATLCQAMSSLNSNGIEYDLVIGGEPVFASDEERAEVEEALARVATFSTRLGWTTPDRFSVTSTCSLYLRLPPSPLAWWSLKR